MSVWVVSHECGGGGCVHALQPQLRPQMQEQHCRIIRLSDKLHELSDAAAALHFCASSHLLHARSLRCAEDLLKIC